MNRQTARFSGGTGETPFRLLRASGKLRCGRGVTGASLAHVHTFDEAVIHIAKGSDPLK